MLRPGLGFDFTGSPPHLTIMLKSVESLAAKAERAKRTTVEYLPLQEGASHQLCLVRSVREGKAEMLATV